MTTYRVGLGLRENTSTVESWVFELPGCRAVGGSVEEVLALLPAVIGDYAAWLAGHGEQVEAGNVSLDVVEKLSSGGEFVFEADREPLSDADIETGRRRVGFAQADLIALTQPLPATVLDWKVPPSAVRIDSIFPDVRTPRDMLTHVAGAMSYHLRGVGDITERVAAPPIAAEDLGAALELTLRRLTGLSAEERSGTVYTRSGPRGESAWTARKSIRRIINHQRFHTREVQQRLCWLTLGVPEVAPVSRE